MATIGLNEGPFLIMTISYENGRLTIADHAENKIPTLTLSDVDSINLAESFEHLVLDRRQAVNAPVRAVMDIEGVKQELENIAEATGANPPTFSKAGDENDLIVYRLVYNTKAYGCNYHIQIAKKKTENGIMTYMKVSNKDYAVKGYFTEDAEKYFAWVLNELTKTNFQDHFHD